MPKLNSKPLEKITPQHRKFVRRMLDGETMAQASASAGFGSTYGSSLMKQPIIRSLLVTEMEKAGIQDSLLASKLREGLNAMTPPRRDGGTQYEDQFVRKQFLDVIFKVRGDYSPERTEHVEKRIMIVMDGRMIDALKDSKAIDAKEADILEAEVVSDNTTMPGEEVIDDNPTAAQEEPREVPKMLCEEPREVSGPGSPEGRT